MTENKTVDDEFDDELTGGSDYDTDASDDIKDYDTDDSKPEIPETKPGEPKPKEPVVPDPLKPVELPEMKDRDHPSADTPKPSETIPDIVTPGGHKADNIPDRVGNLTDTERHDLLWNNMVRLPAETSHKGAAQTIEGPVSYLAAAYLMHKSNGLTWSARFALKCHGVDLQPYPITRYDDGSYSYNEWQSKWQQQTDAKAEVGGGVPLLFDTRIAYEHSNAESTFSSSRKVYFQYTSRLTKARLVFPREKIELSDALMAAIVKAIASGEDAERGRKLFELLGEWGHFVATDATLGGRITLTKVETYTSNATVESSYDQFRAAASGSFVAADISVTADGGTGTTLAVTEEFKEIVASKNLEMEVVGGLDKTASADTKRGGHDWLPSADRYENWKVIGFGPQTMKPITDYFPEDIKEQCLGYMRAYFYSQLQMKKTYTLGQQQTTSTFDDWTQINKPIRRIRVCYSDHLDALHTDWSWNGVELSQGVAGSQGPGSNPDHRWHGAYEDDEGLGDAFFDVDENDEIAAVEVHLANPYRGMPDRTRFNPEAFIRNIRFYTRKGRDSGWWGGSTGADDSDVLRLEAPRVRGFIGALGTAVSFIAFPVGSVQKKATIGSIGLKYYGFKPDTVSPDYLDSLANYLFPNTVGERP